MYGNLFKKSFLILLFIFLIKADIDEGLIQGNNTNLNEAAQFLDDYNREASEICFRIRLAQWQYSTNMTDINKRRMIDEQTIKAKFERLSWKQAITFNWTQLKNQTIQRQLKFLITGITQRESLNEDKFNEIHHLISEMKEIYSKIKVCPLDNTNNENYCNLELHPDISSIMSTSRNPLELSHIWRQFHDEVSAKLKNKYMRYVQIVNQASRIKGFTDASEEWIYMYEDSNFNRKMSENWMIIQPHYKQLYTYVRKQLIQLYGENYLKSGNPIPAHLLGNLWGQDWSGIYNIMIPYPKHKSIDHIVNNELLRQGFIPLRMFQMAEEFFTSMGLQPMPPEFWRFSMMDKPKDRKVQCTSSAWDFCNRIDFRIKHCTEVNLNNLITIHHEMAHIQYYLHYAEQPYLFRQGANPGFHEGIANAISLSIFNLAHLQRVGLYNNPNGTVNNNEENINFLLLMALRKLAFAPFAYLIDEWRYKIFQYGVKTMNYEWWELRLKYQGLVPPISRNEGYFDAASKRHIPADMPYMKYYVALLLEFQIFHSLCIAAGHKGPLHICDLYRSREAGRILSDVLKIGRNKHWKDVLKILTKGKSDNISPESMILYFQPLLSWLKLQNEKESLIGWKTNIKEIFFFQSLLSNGTHIKSISIILFTFIIFQPLIT